MKINHHHPRSRAAKLWRREHLGVRPETEGMSRIQRKRWVAVEINNVPLGEKIRRARARSGA